MMFLTTSSFLPHFCVLFLLFTEKHYFVVTYMYVCMYGPYMGRGAARVPLELEGLSKVVDWMQVQEYAAVTDFVWLQRMNLAPDDPKKEAGKGMCPCHKL